MKKTKISTNAVIILGVLVGLSGCDSSGNENKVASAHHSEKSLKQEDKASQIIHRDTVLIENYLESIGSEVIQVFDLADDTSALRKQLDIKRKLFDFSFEVKNVFVDKEENPLSSFDISGQRINWIKLNEKLFYSLFLTDGENILCANVQTFNNEYKLIDSHPIALQGGDEWDLFRRVGQFDGRSSFKYIDYKEYPRGGFLIQETRNVSCSVRSDGKIKCNQVSSKQDSTKMNEFN